MHAIASFQGELYAGGFVFNFHQNFRYLVKWHNGTWISPGNGTNDGVSTLTATADMLFVGGRFTTAGDTGSNGATRWNGTDWLPFDDGINDQVHVVEQFDGAIVIGGDFIQAGEIAAAHIARRVGGQWEPLGDGTDGPVFDLHEFRGEIIACGAFDHAGGTIVNNIARWDGQNWHSLAGGFTQSSSANAMITFEGDLIVSGYIGAEFRSCASRGGTANDGTPWERASTPFPAYPLHLRSTAES
jgi:hypothetical protein